MKKSDSNYVFDAKRTSVLVPRGPKGYVIPSASAGYESRSYPPAYLASRRHVRRRIKYRVMLHGMLSVNDSMIGFHFCRLLQCFDVSTSDFAVRRRLNIQKPTIHYFREFNHKYHQSKQLQLMAKLVRASTILKNHCSCCLLVLVKELADRIEPHSLMNEMMHEFQRSSRSQWW